jgi:hypothetical protein
VLVAGIQFSIYLVDEYSKENAKRFIHEITSTFFRPLDNNDDVENFMAAFTSNAISFLVTQAVNCSNADILSVEEVESLSNSTDGVYVCRDGAKDDLLCTFASVASDKTTRYEISHQMALLAASGLNITGLKDFVIETLRVGSDSTVDSHFPSQVYM